MTDAELYRLILDSRLRDLHTSMPGRIEKYDASKQVADVKPQLKRSVPNGAGGYVAEDLPVLPNIPVGHPKGGGFFVSFPFQKGDYVWVMFAERSLDAWRRTGEPTDPGDLRMHALVGAYCIPGCAPDSGALSDAHADNLVIGKDGGAQIHVKPNGDICLGGPNANKGVARKGDGTTNGTLIFNPGSGGASLSYIAPGGTVPPLPPGAGSIALEGVIDGASETVMAED